MGSRAIEGHHVAGALLGLAGTVLLFTGNGASFEAGQLPGLLAAFVAWRFLPARARDPLAVEAHDDTRSPAVACDELAASPSVGG